MDTPLTDALFAEMQARDDGYDPDLEMMRDLARRLERDRAELKEALKRLLDAFETVEQGVFEEDRNSNMVTFGYPAMEAARAALSKLEE